MGSGEPIARKTRAFERLLLSLLLLALADGSPMPPPPPPLPLLGTMHGVVRGVGLGLEGT